MRPQSSTPRTRRPLVDRFWEKVDRSGDCWIWQGSLTRAGYGHMGTGGRAEPNIYAHRLAWELLRGPIPPGMEVCHDCPGGDNRACVNPAHLFLGTHLDNMGDMTMKGRGANGESLPQAKLTEDNVRAIRARYARGDIPMSALAREYGVSESTILRVVRRIDWRHVA